jgi:hypothetical protein
MGTILAGIRRYNPMITILAETHFGPNDAITWNRLSRRWMGLEYQSWHAVDKSGMFTGVTIMINQTHIQTRIETILVQRGRIIILKFTTSEPILGTTGTFLVAGVYLPHQTEPRKEALTKLIGVLQENPECRVILAGDFNVPLAKLGARLANHGWKVYGSDLWKPTEGDQNKVGILLLQKAKYWNIPVPRVGTFNNPRGLTYHPTAKLLTFAKKTDRISPRVINGKALLAATEEDLKRFQEVILGLIDERGNNTAPKDILSEAAKSWNFSTPTATKDKFNIDKYMWQTMKGIRKNPKIAEGVKGKSWNQFIDPRDMERYWKDLFFKEGRTIPPCCETKIGEELIPTAKELKGIVGRLQNGSSAGEDGIPYELYKVTKEISVEVLRQRYWTWITNSEPILSSRVVFLYKGKGETRDPGSYRPITLLNTDVKILTRWICRKIKKAYSTWISEEQQGFHSDGWIIRNVRLLVDSIGALGIPEVRARIPHSQAGIAIMLIDLAKAYDSVRWDYIAETMQELDPGDGILEYWVRRMYQPHNTEIMGSEIRLPVNQGVKQGDPLSPHIFNMVIQRMFNGIRNHPGVQSFWGTGGPLNVAYADDVAIYCSMPSLPYVFQELARWSQVSGVSTNCKKSFVLMFPGSASTAETDHLLHTMGDVIQMKNRIISEATQLGYNIREYGEESGKLAAGEYLGFPVHLNATEMVKALNGKVIKKVEDATRRASWLHEVANLTLPQRAAIYNQYVSSIPVYYTFGIYPSARILNALKRAANQIIWRGGKVHPGLGTTQRAVHEGGLGLIAAEVIAMSSVVCAAFLLHKEGGPKWPTHPLQLIRQAWDEMSESQKEVWEGMWWAPTAGAVTNYDNGRTHQRQWLTENQQWTEYIKNIEREELRKTMTENWKPPYPRVQSESSVGWKTWWKNDAPGRILNFGYKLRWNRVQGGPMAHVGKTDGYTCHLCRKPVGRDDCQHFAKNCRVMNQVVRTAEKEGYPIAECILTEWTQLFDSGEHKERCCILTWMLYIGWYGYHIATYKTSRNQVKKSWKQFTKTMDLQIRRGIQRKDKEILRWLDERDTFKKY